MPYSLFCSRRSKILAGRLGVYTIGAALISSQPFFRGKGKGTSSAARLLPTNARLFVLCCLSLARAIPHSFSNLHVVVLVQNTCIHVCTSVLLQHEHVPLYDPQCSPREGKIGFHSQSCLSRNVECDPLTPQQFLPFLFSQALDFMY